MPSKLEGRLVNQMELAGIFGVSTVTIRAWERKGCPCEERGRAGVPSKYNTADVARWREEQAVLSASGDTSAMDMEEARRRKVAAEAALAEHELSLRRGEAILIEHIAGIVGEEYDNIRATFTSLPGDIAAELEHRPAVEIQELLNAKISEILHGLSADGDFAAEEPTGEVAEGEAPPSTEAQSDRVGRHVPEGIEEE